MMRLQDFLADSALKAAQDLKTALHRLPEDKRNWAPADSSRSALDQFAECAMLNGQTMEVVTRKAWFEDFDFQEYLRAKAELVKNPEAIEKLLDENTEKAAGIIRAVPDEDLEVEIQMPWRSMKISEILAYPYWNMSYHEGQINYIASILGCLE
jgi:hypothetical protein